MNLLDETSEIMEAHNKTIEDIEYIYIYKEANWSDKNIIYNSDSIKSLDKLNFDYDNGYGGQEIFGWITFKDNTWLERGEYDGSEWWNFKRKPGPEDLI
ncbi:MAG: hypothetical protein PVF17_05920 [Ignavibacteria bacterium]|jgi:hypothetical protein